MTRSKTTWYAVRALYRSEHKSRNGSSKRTLLEEKILLIRSAPGLALRDAKKEAIRHEHSYKNVYGELVRWKLAQLLAVSEVLDKVVGQGTEIYSRYHANAMPSATIRRLGFSPGETVIR